jgi:O-antigen/teichoic acid export membrane protein
VAVDGSSRLVRVGRVAVMIALNAASQMMALGAILVVQTLYLIVVARVLGPEDFGRFSFAWALVQILLIGGDFGLHNTVIRRVSHCPIDSPQISANFFYLKLMLCLFLLGILGVVAAVVGELAGGWMVLLVFGAGMFFQSLSTGINAVFQSHGKLYLGSFNLVLTFAGQAVFGVTLLWLGGRMLSLALAYLLATVGATAVNAWLFTHRIHPIGFRPDSGWKSFFRESAPVGISTFFHTLSARIGLSLLAFLVGPAATGVYSAAVRLPQALSNIPLGIFGAVLPAMAAHQDQVQPLLRLFRISLLVIVSLAIPVVLFLTLLADLLIQFIYGPAYDASADALKILAWSVVPVFVGMCFSHVLLSQHRLVARLPYVTGVALVANVTACLTLIPPYGVAGASIALLVNETLLALGYVVAIWGFMVRRGERRSE